MKIFTFRAFIISLIISLSIISCKKDEEKDETVEPDYTLSKTITTNITHDATMEEGYTYTVDGTIYVDGATLTIKPGVTVKFTKNSSIIFGVHQEDSKLIANGTSANPITFTSNEYHPAEGDWNNIKFTSGTLNSSSMKYCNILYAGGLTGDNAAIDINDCSITIENCTIDYSDNRGIDLNSTAKFNSFTGNTIKNCTNEAICLYVNNVHTIGRNNKITDSPILVKGGDYNHEFTKKWLYQEVPYIIEGTVNIYCSTGSRLIIDAGNTIKFKAGARFSVGTGGKSGTLVANGTTDSTITFSSSLLYKKAGDWSGLIFDKGASNGCIINNSVIEYGGNNDLGSSNIAFTETHGNVTISNSYIANAKGYGIYIDSLSTPILNNNTFGNNPYGDQFQE